MRCLQFHVVCDNILLSLVFIFNVLRSFEFASAGSQIHYTRTEFNLDTTSEEAYKRTTELFGGFLYKNIEPSDRRLVCFVARVQPCRVIQSAGTTPPSGIRSVLSMAPFACLSRTKVEYPSLPPRLPIDGERVYQVTYFSS